MLLLRNRQEKNWISTSAKRRKKKLKQLSWRWSNDVKHWIKRIAKIVSALKKKEKEGLKREDITYLQTLLITY